MSDHYDLVKFNSEKYGEVVFVNELKTNKKCLPFEWIIWLKAPVHLYDIVDYRPAGPHFSTKDGITTKGYHDEFTDTSIWTTPRNTRIDHEAAERLTEEKVDEFLDWFYQDAIDNWDGRLGCEKIIGIK